MNKTMADGTALLDNKQSFGSGNTE